MLRVIDVARESAAILARLEAAEAPARSTAVRAAPEDRSGLGARLVAWLRGPDGTFGLQGNMDNCTFCSGGHEAKGSQAEYEKYGRNRLSEGKLPACAEMCSTKALLGGDGDVVADIFRNRVLVRGKGSEVWGWGTAYGKPANGAPTQTKTEPSKS